MYTCFMERKNYCGMEKNSTLDKKGITLTQARHESNFHLSEIVLILGKSSDLLSVNNKPLSCEVISNTPCHLKRCIQLT